MEKRSVGRLIWETLSPILVNVGVSYIVLEVISSWICIENLPEILKKVDVQKDISVQMADMQGQLTKLQEVAENFVEQYGVEISAVVALITIPILMFMKRRDIRKDRKAGIVQNKKAPWYKYFLIAGVSIPMAILANNLLMLSNLAEYSVAYQEAAESLYSPSLPVQLLCVGIVIPICEEYMFRGLIYRRIRRDRTAIGAMIFSAFIFGAYHMNLVQAIYGVVCGLLLAYLYEKYGSLKAPILAHILMNIVVCVLSDVNAFTWMFSQPIRMAIITIVCAAIGSSVFLAVRQIDEKPDIPETVVAEVEN